MLRRQSEAVPEPLRVLLEIGSMAGMTDVQLVEQFAAGRDASGEAAFAALVSRHGPMVLATCRQISSDQYAADDAFQAVFMVLARRAPSIRRPELLGPWLHGVAVKIARKARAQAFRRRRREKCEVDMRHIESTDAEAEGRAVRDEEAAAVHEEIGRLSERYRRAVVLCHFEGLSHAEAARLLQCAPGTVGSLVSRARDLLHARLARRGFSTGAVVLSVLLEPKLAAAAVPRALESSTIQAARSFASGHASIATLVSKPAIELARGALYLMTFQKVAIAGALLVALGTAVAAGGLAAGARGREERRVLPLQAQTAPIPSPALPGAVAKPPVWFGNDAPFDVAAFLAAPPPEENAAPRYLEALFEFSPELEMCFPEGSDRQSRKKSVEARLARFFPVFQPWSKDPGSVDVATIDAVVEEFDTGFRKIDWAQKRPRCVFESGISVASRLPHAQAASSVVRATRLKVFRELERGEMDGALRDLARLLRFSRDLIPRGALITQIVSAAIVREAVEYVVAPALASKALTAQHCDQMLLLLRQHEAESFDAYIEGLRAEYVSNRVTLHDLIYQQDQVRKEWGRFGNPVGPSIVAEVAEPVFYSALAGNAPAPVPAETNQADTSLRSIPDLDARIARTSPQELTGQVEKLNEVYRGRLGLAGTPFVERIRKSSDVPRSLEGPDIHTRVVKGLASSAFTEYSRAIARASARIRVAQGLVAVRRWQLAHEGALPPSLEAATKAAGLQSVPLDPYNLEPIRFAIVNGGQPTVYSVGQDGRDDGGKLDNARTPDSGDVLLRLPRS